MAQKFSVKLKFARISPDKIRLILNMIKNKKLIMQCHYYKICQIAAPGISRKF